MSARKLTLAVSSSVLLVGAVLVLACVGILGSMPSYKKLQIGSRTYKLQVADTPSARSAGLSGRTGMDSDQGMLFAFDRPANQCMWMKDMHFALDIIWLSSDKRIQHIELGVSPDTYPQQFCPKVESQYVIEFNAGEAANAGLLEDQQLSF